MALEVISPADFRDDPGCWERVYPIADPINPQSMIYDNQVQKTSYNLANVVAIFDEWFRSFFPPNYFTFVRIKTQSTFAEYKSFMKQIYKKDKPFLVIDPEEIEPVEDSIFMQNMINRYNNYDPINDRIGAKVLYSNHILHDDMCELMFRRNRFRFGFNVMIMEQTLDRQLNTYTKMLMDIRHNSKFLLPRVVPHLIPIRYITNIAGFHGMDYKSDDFLNYLNSISEYPIIRRLTPNGNYMYFFNREMNIQVEVPNMTPSKDSPETSGAIEWGARITDSFYFIADLPAEYIFLLPEQLVPKYDTHVTPDPDQVSFISPHLADNPNWPMTIERDSDIYSITNKVDIMLNEGDDNHFDTKSVIAKDYPDIHSTIMEFIRKSGKLEELVIVKAHLNGALQEAPSTLNNDGILTLINPVPNRIYTLNMYVNMRLVNLIREGKNTKYIGDIKTGEYGTT